MTSAAEILPAGSRFHHVGLACRELERERDGLAPLGYTQSGEPFTDLHQGVIGLFLEGGGPRLELLAPLPGRDVLEPWLQGRAKMYHLAYEVASLDQALEAARDAGARPISAPAAAVAFDNRQICFVMLSNLFLIEMIDGVDQTSVELVNRP